MNEVEVPAEDIHRALLSQPKEDRTKELVRLAIEDDYLRVFRVDVDPEGVSERWVDDHLTYTEVDPHERDWHRRQKIEVARYLDGQGYDVPKVDNPNVDPSTPNFLFDAFEVEGPYGKADVGLPDEGVYAECGRTNPYRVLSAYGLVATLIRGMWQDEETNTQEMILVPYQKYREEMTLSLFFFRRGPDLEVGDAN